jgi:hypothetical protein
VGPDGVSPDPLEAAVADLKAGGALFDEDAPRGVVAAPFIERARVLDRSTALALSG